MIRLEMKNCNMILRVKQQKHQLYHLKKLIYIDKYEYLTREEILPPDQRRVIVLAEFNYSPLGKAFEKQTKTVEDQGEKQIKAFEENKN